MPNPISPSEITPSLVAYLDADVLKSHGGCFHNVDIQPGVGPVEGPHLFLFLMDADSAGLYLCVPLHSEWKGGRIPLRDGEKKGPTKGWIGPDEKSYFSRYQHWKIPASAVVAASGNDDGIVGTRRRYAEGNLGVLDYIIDCQKQNRKQTFDPV